MMMWRAVPRVVLSIRHREDHNYNSHRLWQAALKPEL
jgi:hypothetical protein